MRLALDNYRALCLSVEDSIRWACTLEAIAPKFGNVHPSARFADLSTHHFIIAGDELAESCRTHSTVGDIVLAAVRGAVGRCNTNVNLGISLLIGPLVIALKQATSIEDVLLQMSQEDAAKVYAAISSANPGGLGRVEEMDVHGTPPSSLLAAMKFAQNHDTIARQYATNFQDLFDFVVPTISACVSQAGDVLWGIRNAQVHILAKFGDSLVRRKCGPDIHAELMKRAAELLLFSDTCEIEASEREFDAWLRGDGNRRNPGTTADLIAAGIFVLLTGHPAAKVL